MDNIRLLYRHESAKSTVISVAQAWRFVYLAWDFLGGFLAYTLLYTFRKNVLEPARFGVPEMAWDNFYLYGALLTAGMWVSAMGLVGLYLRPVAQIPTQGTEPSTPGVDGIQCLLFYLFPIG